MAATTMTTSSDGVLGLLSRVTDSPSLCGMGCLINLDYWSTSEDIDHSVSYLGFSEYTLTQAFTYKAYNTIGDRCITTTSSPVSLGLGYSIPLDTTASGVELSAVVESNAPRLLNLPAPCSAKAVLVTVSVHVSTIVSDTFVDKTTKSPSRPLSASSSSVPAADSVIQHDVSWQTKVILRVLIPLVILASAAALTQWIKQKRYAARGRAQGFGASGGHDPEGSMIHLVKKREVNGTPDRHEMGGVKETQELAEHRVLYEIAGVKERRGQAVSWNHLPVEELTRSRAQPRDGSERSSIEDCRTDNYTIVISYGPLVD